VTVLLAVKADTDGGLLDDILAATLAECDAEHVVIRMCGWKEHARLLWTSEAVAALMFDPTKRPVSMLMSSQPSRGWPRCLPHTPRRRRLPSGWPTSASAPATSTNTRSAMFSGTA
jgi:hypothetical protein